MNLENTTGQDNLPYNSPRSLVSLNKAIIIYIAVSLFLVFEMDFIQRGHFDDHCPGYRDVDHRAGDGGQHHRHAVHPAA